MTKPKNKIISPAIEAEETFPVMSREDILGHLEAKIINVPVPKWKRSVRAKPLDLQTMTRLKLEYPDTDEFQYQFLTMALVDLKPEDVKKLQVGNGLKYSQLLDAIMGAGSPLTDTQVGK